MTMAGVEPAAPPALAVDARRLALADLVGRIARGLQEGAARYEAAARQAAGPLRQALERLGRETQAQCAELAPVARELGVPAPAVEQAPPGSNPPAWGVLLGEAFQAERAVGRLARELGTLAVDPSLKTLAARLAARAAGQAGTVRRLYLRYS
jgi:hypothetical protein